MKEQLKKVKKMLLSPSLISIWKWTKRYRAGLVLISLGQMVAAILGLVFTVATKLIIDAAVNHMETKFPMCIVLLTGTILAQLLCNYLLRYGSIKVSSRMRQEMRANVIERVLHKQYCDLANMHSGDITGKILNDTNTVISAVVQIIPSLLCLMTQFIGAVILLFTLDKVFVLTIILLGVLGGLLMIVVGNKMKALHKDTREKEDKVLAAVSENMQNLRIIKASEIEDQVKATIWKRQEAFVQSEIKRGAFSTKANSGINMVFRFSWLYAIIWGCTGIYHGTLSYGSLTALLQLVGQIQGPIANLSQLVAQMYGAVSSAERLDELLGLEDEEVEESTKISYEDLKEIKINHIDFAYDREMVIEDCSFTIEKGDIIAITGHSGCGKSTFFLLLMGLYKPKKGSIDYIVGDMIYHPNRTTRKLISYVPQGNALFSGTLKENICMFKPDATQKEIQTALKAACIDEFVATLDKGLDTLIGEKGLGLSEGQAQRIAVARALLSDTPILLLDEATSALDDKTEASLLEHIQALTDKTCLIVTHRKKALEICNKHQAFA
ncbi:MAG: ABC transporter ATP-binding protein [Holdemanella sp.]|nr:ABC transporter ATP-binding protein [Holdemanella sp.]